MGSCVKHARDAQDKLLWTDKACPAHTQLIMSWKLIVIIIIIINITMIMIMIITITLISYCYYYYYHYINYCYSCYYHYAAAGTGHACTRGLLP